MRCFGKSTILILAAWFAVAAKATEEREERPRHRIVPMPRHQSQVASPRMPPLAEIDEIEDRDDGQTWQQTGTLPASYLVAEREIGRSLRQQNWRLEKRIILEPRTGRRRQLTTWERHNTQVIVMLSEIAIGHTGFAWGMVAE